MTERIRTCVDKQIPLDLVFEAASRAIDESPENLPAVSTHAPLPGVFGQHPLELAILTGKKWQNGRNLTVKFLDGSLALQSKVKAIARQWETYANLTLDFGNHSSPNIRIAFTPGGSWSYLGTDCLVIAQGEATMNYGWLTDSSSDDEISRVVLHEFGHALAAIHEHQSPAANIPWDKPAVYAYYGAPPNNWSKEDVDRNIFTRYSTTVTNTSAFDPESIMLYAIPDSLTIGDFQVGWNRVLSATDKSFIGTMYPRTAPSAIELAITPPYTEASIGVFGEQDLFTFIAPSIGEYRVETFGPTDIVMSLLGPDNQTTVVAEDDDSGSDRNARITARLTPGRYYTRVRHYSATGTGNYEIAVRRVAN